MKKTISVFWCGIRGHITSPLRLVAQKHQELDGAITILQEAMYDENIKKISTYFMDPVENVLYRIFFKQFGLLLLI